MRRFSFILLLSTFLLWGCSPQGEGDDDSVRADDDASPDDDAADDDSSSQDDDSTPGDDDSSPASNADGDCLTDAEEEALGTNPEAVDSDGDGLSDCDELNETGTDPLVTDSDGDGFSDGVEVDCVSNPMDGGEVCYACGWGHNDPGTLVSTGNEEGDVLADLDLFDQCQEAVRLWDFAGEYHILFATAAW